MQVMQQPVGMMMAPPQQAMDVFGNGPLTFTQRVNVCEVMSGCEAKNKYDIAGAASGPMFIDETSDCCERVCCGPNRSLTLNVHQGQTKEDPTILKFKKGFHLNGCCFCRPSFEVLGAGDVSIGKVEDPFNCCVIHQDLFSAKGDKIYTVEGSICQCGLCCPCADAEFPITDIGANQKVGSVFKRGNGIAEMCAAANKFEVQFPQNANVDQKSLLMGAAMLMDIEYFEKSG